MRARPKPLAGALVGLLLALVGVALLTSLGIMAADQVVVWGAACVGLLLGSLLLTQRPRLAPRRMLAVLIAAGASAGMALGGLHELGAGGRLTDGCYLTAISQAQGGAVSPQGTSAFEPFEIARDDVVRWRATSADVLTSWHSTLGVRVGGFDLVLWEGDYPNRAELTELTGEERAEVRLESFAQERGFPLSGVFHIVGTLDAAEGSCTLDVYVRIPPETPVRGFLLLGLWALASVLALTLMVLAYDVRSSIRDIDELARGEWSVDDTRQDTT